MIESAAQVLETFSHELANAWRSQPFNRINLAHAFAAGFVKNESDDVHPTASVILEIAYLDRETRQNH